VEIQYEGADKIDTEELIRSILNEKINGKYGAEISRNEVNLTLEVI